MREKHRLWTPRSNNLERLRKALGQERTPAYGDAYRLCRQLEIENYKLKRTLEHARS